MAPLDREERKRRRQLKKIDNHDLVQEPKDVALIRRFQGRPDYIVPPKVYEDLPRELYDAWNNDEWTPSERVQAARLLTQLMKHNIEKDKHSINLQLHQHVQAAERPERDDEPETIIPPMAFVENIGGEDAQKTLDVLRQLGIEEEITGQ